MKAEISVIVPIYKVEQYLEECVDSLIEQTYKNIEIILVDDGSPDNCGAICDRYAEQDDRIQVIHKKNGGLSDARNAGLDIASGEYVLFIDSDDYVSVDMVEELYGAIKKQNADISVCYFQRVYVGNRKDKITEIDEPKECYSPKELLSQLYTTNNSPIAFVAWNKVYKKTLFSENGIRYPEGKYHEDTFTTYQLLYYAMKIAVVRKPLYFYRIRNDSIMTEGFSEKRLDNLEAMQQEMEFYHEKGETELLTMALNRFCKISILLYNQIAHIKDKNEKKYLRIKLYNNYRKSWHNYSGCTRLPIKKRIVYSLFNYPILLVFNALLESQKYMKLCIDRITLG